MELNQGRLWSLCGMSYEALLRELKSVSTDYKAQISSMKIMKTEIGTLKVAIFIGFENLIILEINECLIKHFEKHVFDGLVYLNSVNLSSNIISSINKDLFIRNQQLKIVIFHNNLLDRIDKIALLMIRNIEILNLSFNNILMLDEQFSYLPNLKQLYLNNNVIIAILSTTLLQVPNLTHLILNCNRIERLTNNVFENLVNLQHLNLNDNLIRDIEIECFWKLKKLTNLHLANNLLTERIDKNLLPYNSNLIELDLSNNNSKCITMFALDNCRNLKIFKLMILSGFSIRTLKPLSFLSKFEFFFKEKFSWSQNVKQVFENFILLTELKLVFQKLDEIRLCNFSNLDKLESLHIECLEPNNDVHDFDFSTIFPRSSQLKYLVLKKLNNFAVFNCGNKINFLKHLNLSGLKNKLFSHDLLKYRFLQHLDLSFSEFGVIAKHALEDLVNLEYLNFEHSKLKSIKSMTFRNNYKLQVLNFSHCLIETIDDCSFSNLHQLKQLNLSHNPLQLFSDRMFYGLNRLTCAIML